MGQDTKSPAKTSMSSGGKAKLLYSKGGLVAEDLEQVLTVGEADCTETGSMRLPKISSEEGVLLDISGKDLFCTRELEAGEE